MAPVHCAAGSDGEMNFGTTSVAAPKAASSSVARYSFTAWFAVAGSRSLLHSDPGIERPLLASASIRVPPPPPHPPREGGPRLLGRRGRRGAPPPPPPPPRRRVGGGGGGGGVGGGGEPHRGR